MVEFVMMVAEDLIFGRHFGNRRKMRKWRKIEERGHE